MLDFKVRCGAIPMSPNMRKVPNETIPVRNVTSGRKRLKSLFVTDCCTPVAICPTRCCAAGQKKKHPPMHTTPLRQCRRGDTTAAAFSLPGDARRREYREDRLPCSPRADPRVQAGSGAAVPGGVAEAPPRAAA